MKTKSFTLIELLVVIVIIGILAGVIIVSTSSSITKASIAKVKVFENSVQNELGANMVSRWKLDEIIGTTTTPDAWGSHTGTLGDGVTTSTYPALKSEAECVTGKCMSFDGVDDYIVVPNNNSFNFGTNNFTISAWVKTEDNRGPIWGKKYYDGLTILGYGIGISDSKYAFQVTDNTVYSLNSTMLISSDWAHVVGVRLGGNRYLYVNGILNNFDSSGGFNISSSSNVFLGWSTFASQFLNGLIDDVRVYNAALTTAQIKQEYVAGLNSLLANNNISKEEYDQRLNVLAQN